MDSSTTEYEHLYENETTGSAAAREFVDQQVVAHEDQSFEGDTLLYSSNQPVAGTYCRFESMTLKFEVVEGGTGSGDPLYFVVLNDFFDSYEKHATFFAPLLDQSPAGSQALFFNFPGQSHTEFGGEGSTLNNAVLARAFDGLLSTLQTVGTFAKESAVSLIGVGNGANVLTYWLKSVLATETVPSVVASVVLINPYMEADAHLSLVLQNWLNTCDISQLFQFDLQLYFFSHLLFSEKYLQLQTPTAAFEAYAAHPNHISLPGRAAICRGAQAHESIELAGWNLAAPLTLIFGKDDHLIRGECKSKFLATQDGVSAPVDQIRRQKHGVHCVELDGGHELMQELPGETLEAIRLAIGASLG